MAKIIEKKLSKVILSDDYDTSIGYDDLVENLKDLLNIEGVEFNIQNKNNRDFKNVLEDVSIDYIDIKIGDKAEEVYNAVFADIENNIDEDRITEYEKFIFNIEENKNTIIENLEKSKVDSMIDTDTGIDIDNFEIYEILEAFSKVLKDDYGVDVESEIDDCIDKEVLANILNNNLYTIEVEVKGYSQSDWDKYYITFDETNIKKIVKETGLTIEKWDSQVEKLIQSLFTCGAVNVYNIYDLKIEKEDGTIIEKQVKELQEVYVYYDIYGIEEEIKEYLGVDVDVETEENNNVDINDLEEIEEIEELMD